MNYNDDIRHRIELPAIQIKVIARRCNCSYEYARRVLSGTINQQNTDLQKNITRCGLLIAKENIKKTI